MKDDWRLEGYRGELNNRYFKHIKFLSTPKNDHEHCIFCFRKITDLSVRGEEYDTEGYVVYNEKTKQTNWVCENCFNDFKDKFGFKE